MPTNVAQDMSCVWAKGPKWIVCLFVYLFQINTDLQRSMNEVFVKYDGQSSESDAVNYLQTEVRKKQHTHSIVLTATLNGNTPGLQACCPLRLWCFAFSMICLLSEVVASEMWFDCLTKASKGRTYFVCIRKKCVRIIMTKAVTWKWQEASPLVTWVRCRMFGFFNHALAVLFSIEPWAYCA